MNMTEKTGETQVISLVNSMDSPLLKQAANIQRQNEQIQGLEDLLNINKTN